MKQCTITIDDEVYCRIGGLHPSDLKVLWDKFGIYVDGYRYMPQFQLGRWDGKIRFFEATGKTYTKLLIEIIPFLDAWHYNIDINDHRVAAPEVTERIDEDFFKLPDFKFRPYQLNAMNALLDAGSGFGELCTGSGKTSMCAAMCMVFVRAGMRVVLIVPSQDLVTQTAKEFEERFKVIGGDITVGTYSGETKAINHPIVIATWQSLQNAPHYMGYFEVAIVDEGHGAKADVVKSLLNDHAKHISYRYGLTGTMPKEETDAYTLKVTIGDVVCRVPAAELIRLGYLSSVDITPFELQDKVDDEDFPDYASERAWLSKHEARLSKVADLIVAQRDVAGNTMVLINSIAQGRLLESMIPGSVFLSGDSKNEIRAENYSQYAERDDIILIATVGIASTGLSIDRIFNLWFVDVGKSFIKCIQSVGRGLRKKGDKSHVNVFDVHSKLKFSKKHFKTRKQYYVEAGYPVAKVLKISYENTSKLIG